MSLKTAIAMFVVAALFVFGASSSTASRGDPTASMHKESTSATEKAKAKPYRVVITRGLVVVLR